MPLTAPIHATTVVVAVARRADEMFVAIRIQNNGTSATTINNLGLSIF